MIRQLPFLLVLVAVALAMPPIGNRVAPAVRRLSAPFVARPRAGLTVLFLVTLALAAGVSLRVFMPVPRIHDEFSHLLAADTFRHGRLANPVHPAWQSLETFHVLQQPTYMSRYAPAPGLFLALGWVVTGMPIAGAWLAYALACAAVAWMLLAFVPRRWAFLGGILVAIHPVMFEWSQSYWGGSVAVLGGALLAGSAGRLRRSDDSLASVLGGVGLFLLANSRPFEGFVLSVVVLGALIRSRVRSRGWSPRRHLALLPMILLGTLTLGFVAFYNARVTGDPLVMPHRAYGLQYAPTPYFVGGEAAPVPVYRHDVMRRYHTGSELAAYQLQSTARGRLVAFGVKLAMLAEQAFEAPFALRPGRPPRLLWIGALVLAGLPWAVTRSKRVRSAALWFAVFVAGCSIALWMQAQYVAPGVCLAVLLVVSSIRALRARWRRSRLVTSLILGFVVLPLSSLAATVAMIPDRYLGPFEGSVAREKITRYLETLPGRDLVVVRYSADHFLHFEWVYNAADVDASEVVWAREAHPEINETLLRHFDERNVWLLEADERPPRLTPVRLREAVAAAPASRDELP
ncbi:MAG: hypothetical protein NDJ92_14930 [Thermoanaerobaculia bacterium]|nr:hypothetical protein [Thermoanaerobaculia bacterium]